MTPPTKNLHLYIMDSFPPMLYQALSAHQHLQLLKPLLHFIIGTLNNSFYREHIQFLESSLLDDYLRFPPSQQIKYAFSHLRQQLDNPLSHCALNLAERHLSLLGSAPLPTTKLAAWPTLYFTKQKQPYLDIINQIGLSEDSTDHLYFSWNHYFSDLTRCGIELDCEHLGALHTSHRQAHQRGPEAYWVNPLNAVPSTPLVSPTRFFRVNRQTTSHDISVFFLDARLTERFITQLQSLELIPRVFYHEKHTEKSESSDKHLNMIATLFFSVPPDRRQKVYALLEQHDIKQKKSRQTFFVQRNTTHPERPVRIDLHLFTNPSNLLCISTYVNTALEAIIDNLKQLPTCRQIDYSPKS